MGGSRAAGNGPCSPTGALKGPLGPPKEPFRAPKMLLSSLYVYCSLTLRYRPPEKPAGNQSPVPSQGPIPAASQTSRQVVATRASRGVREPLTSTTTTTSTSTTSTSTTTTSAWPAAAVLPPPPCRRAATSTGRRARRKQRAAENVHAQPGPWAHRGEPWGNLPRVRLSWGTFGRL